MPLAYIGIGSNLGDPVQNVRRALQTLGDLGAVRGQSALYRTEPWGKRDQPPFINAVAALETAASPHELLGALKSIEAAFGREEDAERWGPRVIDLDILTYGDLELADPQLRIPHPRLYERAFVLVPLAELDERYARSRDALPGRELGGVMKLLSESVALMSEDQMTIGLAERVRELTELFVTTDLMRLRIEWEDDHIELARPQRAVEVRPELPADLTTLAAAPVRLDSIKADLVGIFHLSRPAPAEGDLLEGERELAYIEALGIRNPVRSLGGGRIVSVKRSDGDAVEYGEVLFEIDRG